METQALDARRSELHQQVRQDLLSAREKAFEQFDGAVLSLSTGGLGVSLAFLDNVVKFETAAAKGVLVVSWALFAAAILSTLISFLTSQKAIDRAIQAADDYYRRGIEAAAEATSGYAKLTLILNRISAAAFALAVVCTVVFVAVNIL